MEHAWGKAHTWGKANARGCSWVGPSLYAPAALLLPLFGRPTASAPAISIVSAENGPTSHAWSTHGARRTRVVAGGLMV